MTGQARPATPDVITTQYLRQNPKHVFVFGDNLIRKGKKGAAMLRDEPNAYGFITKKEPSYRENAYYTKEEYATVLREEIGKLISLIERYPQKTYLISALGSGLANRHGIYESLIQPALQEMAEKYPNVVLIPPHR